jgi:hypothetical protein
LIWIDSNTRKTHFRQIALTLNVMLILTAWDGLLHIDDVDESKIQSGARDEYGNSTEVASFRNGDQLGRRKI